MIEIEEELNDRIVIEIVIEIMIKIKRIKFSQFQL